MGASEIYLRLWHSLKLRWYLRGTCVLKWQLCNEMLLADEQHRVEVSEMHQRCDPQYFNHHGLDAESKRTILADIKTIFGAFRWFSVGDVTLYTKQNSAGRPYQVWLYNHRSRQRNQLFEENNPSCTVDVAVTRDHKFITINSNTRTSSEVYVLKANELPLDCLYRNLQLVRKRQPRVEYYVDHAHSQFYILSNDSEDKEFKVMVSEDDAINEWRDYYVPTQDIILQDMELYQKHVVLYGLRNLIPIAIVIDAHDRTKQHEIMFAEEGCHLDKSYHNKFESDEFYFWLSSPVKPPFLLTSKVKQTLDPELKQISPVSKKPITSHGFATKRCMATSKDGYAVPLTMCYRTDLMKQDGTAPLLVHVYGCYGENLHMAYRPEKQPLLDRGWVLVYCHVRGGGELGRKWYYDGMGENKHRSFMDLYACVDYVQSELNISRPELTALVGRSAGALPVAMFCNLWPHKAQAALLQFPLVNLVHSLSDPSSYLSIKDMEEFGGNTSSQQHNSVIRSICPYCSLTPQDYPTMYITAARQDEVIPFEGVKKYVEELESCIKQHKGYANHQMQVSTTPDPWRKKATIDRGTVLFNINHSHGHYYSSSKEKYQEACQQYTFLMKVLPCP